MNKFWHILLKLKLYFLKDVETAGVEMRIAQRIQREIEIDHEKELARKKRK